MAGPTIASAEVDVDLDGSGMPRQAQRIAKSAGQALGKELVPYSKRAGEDSGEAFSDGFGDSTNRKMGEIGRSAGRQVESAFRVDSEGIAKRFSNQLEDNTVQGMRVIGQKAGTEFGSGFQVDSEGIASDVADSTGKELAPRFRSLGERSAVAYGEGWGGMDVDRLRRPVLELESRIVSDSRNIGDKSGNDFGDGFDRAARRALRRSSRRLLFETGRAGWEDIGNRSGGRFAGGFNGGLFSGMDRTVALVLKLIGTIGPQMAALGSALSASLVAILSSALMGLVGSLTALAPVAGAAALAIGLTVSAMDDMRAQTPGLTKAIDGVSAAWERQSDALATQVGPALRDFLDTLTGAMDASGFGEAIGRSVASITGAFTAVLNSPGFAGFMAAMSTTIPAALTGFGTGIAKLSEALLGVFASAGPVAQRLGEDFQAWATGIADAANAAAGDGSLQKFFDDAYASMDALMGLLGPLSGGLWNVFQAGQGSGDRLLGVLGGLAQRFEEWSASLEGQTALSTWFSQAEGIFDSLLDLIGVVGTTLADMVTPDTLASVDEFLQALQDIVPIVGEVLSTIGSFDILNLFANVLLGLLRAIEPVLPLLQDLGRLIGSIPAEVIQTLAVAIAGVATAFAVLIGSGVVIGILTGVVDVLAVLGTLVPALGPAISGFSAVLAALGGPVTAIIAVVALLVAGLTYFFTQTETGRKAWSSFVGWLKDLWQGLVTWFTGTFLPAMQSVWDGIVTGINAVSGFFGSVWQAILDAPRNVVNWFTGTFIPFFKSLPGLLLEGLIAYVQFWISLPGRIIGALATLISFLIEWGANAAVALIGWVQEAIPKMISFFAELPGKVLNAIVTFGPMVLAWITKAWDAVVNFSIAAFIAYVTFWRELPGRLLAAVQSLLALMTTFFTNLWATIVSVVQTGVENVLRFFRELPGRIVSALASLLNSLRGVFSEALGEGNRAALDGIARLVNTMGEIPGKILRAVGSLASTLYGAGQALIQGLINGISSMSGEVGRKIKEIANKAVDTFKSWFGIKSPSTVMADVGKNLMLGLGGGISGNANRATGPLNDVASDMLGTRFGARGPGFAMAGAGAGRSVSIGAGAIVVNVPTDNPEQAANAVLDRLVARWK